MKIIACVLLIYEVIGNLILLNKAHTNPLIYEKHREDIELYQISNKIVEKRVMLSKEYYWCYFPIVNSLIPSPSVNIT